MISRFCRGILTAARNRTIQARDLAVQKLTHELARLRRGQFAAESEQMDPDQCELFDEAMAAGTAAVEAELEAELATIQSSAQKAKARRTPRRRLLSVDLPREEVIHAPEHNHCRTATVKWSRLVNTSSRSWTWCRCSSRCGVACIASGSQATERVNQARQQPFNTIFRKKTA